VSTIRHSSYRKPCQHRSEENYFFALSKYQQQLQDLIEGTDFVQPTSRRNEVLGWVNEGVRDFSISRSAVSWGIPMAQDPSHTVYVWFDALNGYLSGLLPLPDTAAAGSNGGSSDASSSGSSDGSSSGSSVERALQQGWPADVHVIGKDILRFHAIYWPGMLMAAGLPLPKQVREVEGTGARRDGGSCDCCVVLECKGVE
jgi:methionyl-tRNA synthetase